LGLVKRAHTSFRLFDSVFFCPFTYVPVIFLGHLTSTAFHVSSRTDGVHEDAQTSRDAIGIMLIASERTLLRSKTTDYGVGGAGGSLQRCLALPHRRLLPWMFLHLL
jgi:hypothetical protein